MHTTARKPVHLFFKVMATICLAEAAIMVLLPRVVRHGTPLVAIADAILLTTFSAPFLWVLISNPLRSSDRTRRPKIAPGESGGAPGSLEQIGAAEVQALRASEHRYHALFENMLNGFAYCRMLYDGEGRPDDFVYLEVNPAFGRLVGLNDVVGKRVTEVIPGIKESHPDLFEIYGRVASSGEPASFEFHLEILDIWFSISAYSPEPGHFAAVFDNVTEQKRALKQLIDTKEEWERTFDAIVDPVMILGPGHEILRANRAMSALVGATPFAISGLLCHECLHGSGTPPTSCPHAQLMADGKPHAEEIHVPMLGRHFAVVVSPLFGPNGEVQGSIHYARDITQQKALEAQLRHSQKMEAIGTLAGGVAHDFNNILTAIIGYGTLLLRQLSAGTQSWDFTSGILQAADRAAGLTSSLLAFSRKKEVELRVVSLNQVVSEAQNILRRLVREDIVLRPKLGLGELTVLADQGQLEQVLINFAVNAQDAMHGPGVIAIGTESFQVDCDFVKSTGCGTPGSYALMTFTDSGGGMDEETVQRIFEPFFTTKELGKGTGLGLAIAYGIVKQHNGFIRCSSEPGVGTTFRVYLPLVDRPLCVEKPEAELNWRMGSETVLLVENDQQIRAMLGEVLRQSGYEVIAAADGEDAVRRLTARDLKIDLAILDVVMPGMSGREVYRAAQAARPGLKVLFISGHEAEITRLKGEVKKGRFLPKPIQPQELLAEIRLLLD